VACVAPRTAATTPCPARERRNQLFPVSPLTPATFLIVGLAGIELGAHQRFAIPLLLGASLLKTVAAVLFGVFPP
jgi:Mg2+/citrate symporter